MKRLNVSTRSRVNVYEVKDIWRTCDQCLYTVYKDDGGRYYMNDSDGSLDITELNGKFSNDEDAVAWAQRWLDDVE